MAPLIVHLMSFFCLSFLRSFDLKNPILSSLSLRAEVVSIGFLFITTGIAHFTTTTSMAEMLPEFMPFKVQIIYFTGVFEILLGLALTANGPFQKVVGVALCIFLIMSLPINIYSALYDVGLGAKGVSYLYFRIPLQVFWLGWIWFFIVKGISLRNFLLQLKIL